MDGEYYYETREKDSLIYDAVTGEIISDQTSDFYREDLNYDVWMIDLLDATGMILFTFDKKFIYNYFRDYPNNITEEQKRIFDGAFPYWGRFYKE